jgi:hypothetical protein
MKPIKQDRYPAGVNSVARQTTFATGSGSRSFQRSSSGCTHSMIENWQ